LRLQLGVNRTATATAAALTLATAALTATTTEHRHQLGSVLGIVVSQSAQLVLLLAGQLEGSYNLSLFERGNTLILPLDPVVPLELIGLENVFSELLIRLGVL